MAILIVKASVAIFVIAFLFGFIFTFKQLKIKRFSKGIPEEIIVSRKKIYLYAILVMMFSFLMTVAFLPPIEKIVYEDEIKDARQHILIHKVYDLEKSSYVMKKSYVIKGFVEKHITIGLNKYAIVSNNTYDSNINSETIINYVYVLDNDEKLEDKTRINIISKVGGIIDIENEDYNGELETMMFDTYIIENSSTYFF